MRLHDSIVVVETLPRSDRTIGFFLLDLFLLCIISLKNIFEKKNLYIFGPSIGALNYIELIMLCEM